MCVIWGDVDFLNSKTTKAHLLIVSSNALRMYKLYSNATHILRNTFDKTLYETKVSQYT